MKIFHIYRDIRRRALIFGLPVSLFAIQMLAVIGSLLVVIFSFGFSLAVGSLVVNATLYVVLIKLTNSPNLLQVANVFPKVISNKKTNLLHYDGQS